MDENELRLAAVELLLMELLALADPSVRLRLATSIAEGLSERGEPGFGGDEHTIRQQALQIIKDADQRFVLFTAAPTRTA